MTVRSEHKLLAAIVMGGLALRLYGLGEQPPTTDDLTFAMTALSYVHNGFLGYIYEHHPPLRHILLWLFSGGSEFGPYAFRAPSLIASTMAIPLTYALVAEYLESRPAALMAAFLMAVDQVNITYARQCIGEPVTPFFILAGALAFLRYHKTGSTRALILAGVIFGVGTASKFHALQVLLFCLGVSVWSALRARSLSRAATAAACLSALPFAVFLLAHLPWFARGHGLREWVELEQVVIGTMLNWTGTPNEWISQTDFSALYWFVEPSSYAEFFMSEGRPHVVLSFSNILVWGLVLPGLLHVVWKEWRALRPPHGAGVWKGTAILSGRALFIGMFVASYLPLAAASRPIYVLSSLSTLPFAFGLVAMLVEAVASRAGRWLAPAFVLLALLTNLALYPMAIGKALDFAYTDAIAERFGPHRENISAPTISP